MVTLNEAVHVFHRALEKTSGVLEGGDDWWPGSQTHATTLSWAVALEWLWTIQPTAPWWFCTAWGTGAAYKRRLLDGHHVRYDATAPALPPRRGKRRIYPHQYLVDISGSTGGRGKDDYLLTMESEVASRHGVGSVLTPWNGYAWDFSKLLYIDSPLRLFLARVGACGESGEKRRTDLWNTMAVLTAQKNPECLIVYVLAEGRREKRNSEVGLWGGPEAGFHRQPIFEY